MSSFPPGMELELKAEDVENGGTQVPAKEESQSSVDAVQNCFQLGFTCVGQFIVSVQDVWQCSHVPEGVREKLAVFIRETWPVIQNTTTLMDELDYVLESLITSKHFIAQIFEKSEGLPLELAIQAAREADKGVDLRAIKDKMLKLAGLIRQWNDVQGWLKSIGAELTKHLPKMQEVAEKFESCHRTCGIVIIAGTVTVTSILIATGALGELPQHVVSLIASYPGRTAATALLSGYGYYSMTEKASRHTVNFISHLINIEKNADLAFQEVAARAADLEKLYAAVEDMVNKTTAVHTVVKASTETRAVGNRGDFMNALRSGDDDKEAVRNVLTLMEKPEVRKELAGMAKDDLDKCTKIEETVEDWKEHAATVRKDFVALRSTVEFEVGADKFATLEMTRRKDE